MAERDKNDTGVTTYDKLPRGQKEEIDNRRRAAVKAAESMPQRRMSDIVVDMAALSPLAPRDSGGAQNRYSASRQEAIDAAKNRAEYKDLKSGPTKLFKMPEGTPGMPISEKSSLGSFKVEDYAKGGMTASKRADGIAQRGKTRGRMV